MRTFAPKHRDLALCILDLPPHSRRASTTGFPFDAARIGIGRMGLMRLSLSALALSSSVLAFVSPAHAAEFVSAVPNYTEGSFATVSGTHYTATSGALGQPSPIVGAGTAFAGIL